MESEQKAGSNIADTPELARKEWRRPELRKLPIAATASSPSKSGSANCDSAAGLSRNSRCLGADQLRLNFISLPDRHTPKLCCQNVGKFRVT